MTVTAIITMVANNRTKIALIRGFSMVSPPCLIYILLYCKSVRPGSINFRENDTVSNDLHRPHRREAQCAPTKRKITRVLGAHCAPLRLHDCKGSRRHNCYAHYPLSILNFAQKRGTILPNRTSFTIQIRIIHPYFRFLPGPLRPYASVPACRRRHRALHCRPS